MESLTVAEAQAQLAELVARMNGSSNRLTITIDGRPVAVLMSLDDLESLEETLVVLSDAEAVLNLIAVETEIMHGKGEPEARLPNH